MIPSNIILLTIVIYKNTANDLENTQICTCEGLYTSVNPVNLHKMYSSEGCRQLLLVQYIMLASVYDEFPSAELVMPINVPTEIMKKAWLWF